MELRGKYTEMEVLRKQEETRQQKLIKAREELAAAELELESLNPYEPPKDELVSVLLVTHNMIYLQLRACLIKVFENRYFFHNN